MVEGVRLFLRDYADLNRLTEGEDHSDRHIYWSILLTLSDWATTPPFVGQNDINLIVDRGWFALFLQGVVIKLLESLGILHMRNYLAYSDGGVNLQTENPQMIQAWEAARPDRTQHRERVVHGRPAQRAALRQLVLRSVVT
jgi:hypothetical protein